MHLLTERETFFQDSSDVVHKQQSNIYPNINDDNNNLLSHSHHHNKHMKQVSQSIYPDINDNNMMSSQYLNQASSLLNNKNGNNIQPTNFRTTNTSIYSPAIVENPSLSGGYNKTSLIEGQSYYHSKPSSPVVGSTLLLSEQQQQPVHQYHKNTISLQHMNPIISRPNSSLQMDHNSNDVPIHDNKNNIYGRISPMIDFNHHSIQQQQQVHQNHNVSMKTALSYHHSVGTNNNSSSKHELYDEPLLGYDLINDRPHVDLRNRMYDRRVIEQQPRQQLVKSSDVMNQTSSLGSMFDSNDSHIDYASQRMAPNSLDLEYVSQKMAPNSIDFVPQRHCQHVNNENRSSILNFNQPYYDNNYIDKDDIYQQLSSNRSSSLNDLKPKQGDHHINTYTSSNNEYIRQGGVREVDSVQPSQRPYLRETTRITSFANEQRTSSFNSSMDNSLDMNQLHLLSDLNNNNNNNTSNNILSSLDPAVTSSRRPSTTLYNATVDVHTPIVDREDIAVNPITPSINSMLDLSFLSPHHKQQYHNNITTTSSTSNSNTSLQCIDNDPINYRKSFSNASNLSSNSPPLDTSPTGGKLMKAKSTSRLLLPAMNNNNNNNQATTTSTTASTSPCDSPKLLLLSSRKNSSNETSPNNSISQQQNNQQLLQQLSSSYLNNSRNRTMSEASSVGSLFELVADLVLDQSTHSNASTSSRNSYLKNTNAFMNSNYKNRSTTNINDEDVLLSSSLNSNSYMNNEIISRENSSNSILSENIE